MPSASDVPRRPRLVVDNSSLHRIARRPALGKMPVEAFQHVGREPAATLDAVEEAAMLGDDRSEPRLRDSELGAELLRIADELFLEGQRIIGRGRVVNLHGPDYAVKIPPVSTVSLPNDRRRASRDNYRVMYDGLPERIERRLAALDLSARAASLSAGMGTEGIRNILRGKSLRPRYDRLERLAVVLNCRLDWLLHGTGPVEAPAGPIDLEREDAIISRYRAMSDDQRAILDAVADSILATDRKREAG